MINLCYELLPPYDVRILQALEQRLEAVEAERSDARATQGVEASTGWWVCSSGFIWFHMVSGRGIFQFVLNFFGVPFMISTWDMDYAELIRDGSDFAILWNPAEMWRCACYFTVWELLRNSCNIHQKTLNKSVAAEAVAAGCFSEPWRRHSLHIRKPSW